MSWIAHKGACASWSNPVSYSMMAFRKTWPTVLCKCIPAESIPLTPSKRTPNREESLPYTCATPHVVFAVGSLFYLGCLVVKSESSLPSLPEGLLPAPVAEAILVAEYNRK